MDEGLGERLFEFAVRVIEFSRKLPHNEEYKIIKYQLIKAATSGGANYEEAQSGASKADFFNKINIALKEIREASYWLRILDKIYKSEEELKTLIDESQQLKKILGSICVKRKHYKN